MYDIDHEGGILNVGGDGNMGGERGRLNDGGDGDGKVGVDWKARARGGHLSLLKVSAAKFQSLKRCTTLNMYATYYIKYVLKNMNPV